MWKQEIQAITDKYGHYVTHQAQVLLEESWLMHLGVLQAASAPLPGLQSHRGTQLASPYRKKRTICRKDAMKEI